MAKNVNDNVKVLLILEALNGAKSLVDVMKANESKYKFNSKNRKELHSIGHDEVLLMVSQIAALDAIKDNVKKESGDLREQVQKLLSRK